MNIKEKDIKAIHDCISRYCYKFQNKRIVIFGCTPYVKTIVDTLGKFSAEVSLILDNNSKKAGNGKTCLGYPTITPDEYFVTEHIGDIYIICSKYAREMRAQLLDNGVPKDSIIIIFVTEMLPLFADTMEEFDNSYVQVENGWTIYRTLSEKIERNTLLFLCPYQGTGDVYMACSYLEEYIKIQKIEKYILVVIGENCKCVAELFGYMAVVLTEKEMQLLLKAWEFLGSELIYAKPLLHWGWRTKKFLSSDKHPQITFNEMFVYDTYEFESEYSRVLPKQKNIEITEKYFNKNNLYPGRTVLLAPYAGSFKFDIAEEEWEQIAEGLKTLNYSVCSNCVGNERPIRGTMPVEIPYDEIINFVDYAGGFVGVRSGLCDILSSSTAKLVVLYASGFNASSIDYFGLKNMGLNEKAYELVVDQEGAKFIDKVLKIFSDEGTSDDR